MEAFTPGVIDKLGFGWDVVSKENPRLVYASVSGYGQTGPYSSRAGYDPCIQAEVGLIEATGPRAARCAAPAPRHRLFDRPRLRRRHRLRPARPAQDRHAASASTSRCSTSACT